MASRNVENGIKYLFDAFNAHDLAGAMAGYAPDVRFVSHSRGRVVVGADPGLGGRGHRVELSVAGPGEPAHRGPDLLPQ